MLTTTLLLFDIDGTLVRGSRAGRTSMARAVQTCLGIADDLSGIPLGGRTDRVILKDILDRHGLTEQQVDVDEFIAVYLRYLEDAVRADPGMVCPGVRPLLEALSSCRRTWLVLGTGNLEPVAWKKLAAHGLDAYFETGGFGSDAAARDAVIATGITRAEARYGTAFERIVVIGDTPHDVACAQANGIHSLAVATGSFDLPTLHRAGPTLAFADLTQTDAVIGALDALPPINPCRSGRE